MNGPKPVCISCGSNDIGVQAPVCEQCAPYYNEECGMEVEFMRTTVSTCVGCGCTDLRACTGGCSWLAVNHDDGTGVCTSCAGALAAWRHQQAEPDALRRQALLRVMQQEQPVHTKPGALDL